MTEPAIRIEGLVVRGASRSARPLLGPVDLEVKKGQHVLIVGASGCGKTTLLRAIAGLVKPDEGSIALFGETASTAGRLVLPPEARGVGMLFQGGALWPHMSVAKTLRFAAKQAGDTDSARVQELLSQVRLEGFEKRMPANLSGGERQRLALARAMAARPRLLLLDEPLGPLDAELRSELLERLADLHESQGWTTLHVTHDPDEARSRAHQVIHLRDGKLIDATQSF